MSHHRSVSGVAFFVATFALAATSQGCASATDATDAESESALSAERSRVLPTDDAARADCRAVATKVYCSAKEAEAAARCAKNGKAVIETIRGRCDRTEDAYPTVESCKAPLERDCSWYAACLERAVPCGADGYALGFGEKYCTAFRDATFSAAGRTWVTKVMQCLQRALVDDVTQRGKFASEPASPAVCKTTFDKAFASHPGCYTAKDASICALPPGDLAKVLSTIGLGEILRPRTGAQMLSTAAICVGQITERILWGKPSNRGASPQDAFEGSPGDAEDEVLLDVWKGLEAGSTERLESALAPRVEVR